MDSMANPPARLTDRDDAGRARLVQGASESEALERLAAYEELAAGLRSQLADTTARADALRAEGKVKTVTYRQLTANKVSLKEMLAHFSDRGL